MNDAERFAKFERLLNEAIGCLGAGSVCDKANAARVLQAKAYALTLHLMGGHGPVASALARPAEGEKP